MENGKIKRGIATQVALGGIVGHHPGHLGRVLSQAQDVYTKECWDIHSGMPKMCVYLSAGVASESLWQLYSK